MGRTFVFVTPRAYVATSQDIRNELIAFSYWETAADDDLCDADEVVHVERPESQCERLLRLFYGYTGWKKD